MSASQPPCEWCGKPIRPGRKKWCSISHASLYYRANRVYRESRENVFQARRHRQTLPSGFRTQIVNKQLTLIVAALMIEQEDILHI